MVPFYPVGHPYPSVLPIHRKSAAFYLAGILIPWNSTLIKKCFRIIDDNLDIIYYPVHCPFASGKNLPLMDIDVANMIERASHPLEGILI